MKQVTALFRHGGAARTGVDALVEASFASASISVLMKDRAGVTPIEVAYSSGVEEGILAGGAIGAALGLTAVVAFPGLLAVGPVLLALEELSVVAAGAGGGAALGAVSGLGWWHIEADIPDRAIQDGAILVGVSVPNARCEEATAVLQHAGADRVDSI